MSGSRQVLSYGCIDMDVMVHTLLHRQRLAPAIPHLACKPSYSPKLGASLQLSAIREAACSLDLNADPAASPPG